MGCVCRAGHVAFKSSSCTVGSALSSRTGAAGRVHRATVSRGIASHSATAAAVGRIASKTEYWQLRRRAHSPMQYTVRVITSSRSSSAIARCAGRASGSRCLQGTHNSQALAGVRVLHHTP